MLAVAPTCRPLREIDCNRVEAVENQVGVFAPFWLVNEFEPVLPH